MFSMAKVFTVDGDQCIQLPEGFALDCDEVCIERVGSALLVYEPSKRRQAMAEAIGQVDENFMANRNQPPAAEDREPLDE